MIFIESKAYIIDFGRSKVIENNETGLLKTEEQKLKKRQYQDANTSSDSDA